MFYHLSFKSHTFKGTLSEETLKTHTKRSSKSETEMICRPSAYYVHIEQVEQWSMKKGMRPFNSGLFIEGLCVDL